MEQRKKVAIYCRVSSDSQEKEKTIEEQRTELPPYAELQGWEVYDTYEDEARSGAYMEQREDFQRLLRDMEQCKFDLLLVTEHDRVTRTENLAERGLILEALRQSGVKLVSPTEPPIDLSMAFGDVVATAQLSAAAEERKKIARRMKRGKTRKLKQGEYPQPSVPYGLRRYKDHTVDPARNVVEVNPPEYEVLRLVYDLVVNQGKSLTYCADHLNQLGKRSRKGKRWQSSWLSQILSNEGSMTGTLYSNRYDSIPTGKFNAKGKMKYQEKEKPRDQWIGVKVPAIFTKEEYKRLRQAISKNRRHYIVEHYGDERFLLRGKLRCGICGRNYETVATKVKGKRYDYYQCTGRVRKKWLQEGEKACTTSPKINARALDHQVAQSALMDLLRSPKRTIKEWQASTKGTVGKGHINKLRERLEYVNGELDTENRKLDKLLSEELVGTYPTDMIQEKARTIERAMRTLNEKKSELEFDLRQAEQLQANLKVVHKYEDELKRFRITLRKKFKSIPVVDKQRLLGYFIPHGSYIEIERLDEDHPVYVKVPGSKIRSRQTWRYRFVGAVDMKAFLEALNQFEQTGTVPEPATLCGVNQYNFCYMTQRIMIYKPQFVQ